MTNNEIATLLRNIAAAYTIKDENKYRFQIIAYQKSADAIESSTSEVSDLIKENALENLPGIGPSIRAHLEELMKNKKVSHFESILKDIPPSVFPLLNVTGFGPKKAYKLVTHFKLKNKETVINDLSKIAKEGKIAEIEGFGEKSQADIIRAIQEYRLGKGKTTRMVLPFAFELAEKMLSYLKQSHAVIKAYPLGSLRRMVSTIGDVDIAVSTNEPQKVIAHFLKYPYKERVIEHGEAGASLLVNGGKQIDLLVQPPNRFGSLLQHFTGSKNHNVRLREYAVKKGLSLSEYGIKDIKTGKTLVFDSEEKFYQKLGMDWIPPVLREDKGEIELAILHKLPRLVDIQDIKGDLHIHSSFPIEPSHDMGKDSMERMIEKAIELRYEYLGFSEHNPSISNHTENQIYSILSRRKEKIEHINGSKKNIRVISFIETDILSNGNLALSDKCLGLLDAVIISIHSAFGMNKDAMTKRALQGLSHPKAKILSHPTGRILNERSGYELDFGKIFAFCKDNNKALEINAWPTRLDLSDIMVKEAVESGVKMAINTDSHAAWQMDAMKFGVAVAQRGWATKKDILNTMHYTEFIQWLKT